MGNIEQTITIHLPSDHQKDELIECILFLKVLASNYPLHLDIAYEALRQVHNLPPEMQFAEASDVS